MSLLNRLRSLLLGKKPISKAEAPPRGMGRIDPIDQLPPFTLATAEQMRFDPQIRIGLAARNGLLMSAEVEVESNNPRIAEWVVAQWKRIWQLASHQLLRAKLYGFLPIEVMYRLAPEGPFRGMIEVDGMIDRHPSRARVLQADGRIVGFELVSESSSTRDRVPAPKGLVVTFDAEFAHGYGHSLLSRAYPAWFEKWMRGGAKRTLRLRMIKDAYVGDIFWYPPDKVFHLEDGSTLTWRDIAKDIVEARLSGGALTLPLVYDDNGRRLTEYSAPRDTGAASSIFEWKREVDLEIWKALEIPPEVIEASRRGSFSGRSIPLVVAASAVQTELAEVVRCVDRDVLQPLVRLNFGVEPDYLLRPKPVLETLRRAWQVIEDSPGSGSRV
jgi:hypothetical protein